MLGERETAYAVKLWEVVVALSEEKGDLWSLGELADAMQVRVTPSLRKRVNQLVADGSLFRYAMRNSKRRWQFFYYIQPIMHLLPGFEVIE